MINRLYAHRHYPNLEPEYATVIKMVMTTVRRLQLIMIELMMMMQMMRMIMMTMTVCASDFTSSLVHMVRALVEVPHVRIVSVSQLNGLADLIDRCPKKQESLHEGRSTNLPFSVRTPLGQPVLCEPIVDPSVVDYDGLWLFSFSQALYEIVFVQLRCLGLKRLFRETAHDLGIDRVPCY